jgi:hypothetical protein
MTNLFFYNSSLAMFWHRKIPWFSLGLLALSYGIFGWIYSGLILTWTKIIINNQLPLFTLDIFWVFYGLGVIFVIFISMAFTAPITIFKLFVGDWFKSDKSAVVSVLLWALAVVLIASWLAYVVRLLVLLSSAILARLELQTANYTQQEAIVILGLIALISYSFGIWTFQSSLLV